MIVLNSKNIESDILKENLEKQQEEEDELNK